MRRALASLGLACLLDACITDAGYQEPLECAGELTECDRECVDERSDPRHCGACGASCGSDALCVEGECMCGGGLVSCAGGCVDTATDPEHCGACEVACPQEEVCSGGRCTQSCQAYETECGQACVDVTSNHGHCGGCDEACAAGRSCRGGNCICSAGTQDCDGVCVAILNDPKHCGACGTGCSAGQVCSAGRCVCPGGSTLCDDECVDLFSDANHCGACSESCAGSEVCSAGSCQPECGSGLSECSQSCVDLERSERHCGECDTGCSPEEVCENGQCQCGAEWQLCAGSCVDVLDDESNCGTCGLACARDQTCNSGQCQCPAGTTLCGTACVRLEGTPGHCGGCKRQCTGGEVCSGGACVADCMSTEARCGSYCVDLRTSATHCGECATSCEAGFLCGPGGCECAAGTSECNGGCVDTNSSKSHCGQCGQSCARDERCVDGQCQAPTECSESCAAPSGITSGCARRFMYGVNYAWEVFAGDFGGIPEWNEPGVAENEAQVDERLGEMAAHGVDVVRWWVWPDFRGDGVEFDDSDMPTGLGATALSDLERALELAATHDIHLMLTLFSFDNFRPTSTTRGMRVPGISPIATDPTRRAALIDRVVRPFARTAEQSPHKERLVAWEVINEPEWAMIGPSKYCGDERLPAQSTLQHLTHDQMEVFVAGVIAGLRAESSALVTVGGAAVNWACAWKQVDIDFYQFHIYDWVDEWHPYDRTPADYGITDKPAIIGEFPVDGLSRADYTELVDYWYKNGWAGALSWAVTDGGFSWDESKAAVLGFASEHACETHY